MTLTSMLVPAYGKNTDKHWKDYEEHSDHETTAIDLENGYFIMKCVEHNVPHIIAVHQS